MGTATTESYHLNTFDEADSMRLDLRCTGPVVRRCPIGGAEPVNFHTIHNAKPVQRSDQR
jgi:hypothetical protein